MTSQKTFFGFQCFGYHVSVEHDEKHPQPKFGGNRFMGAWEYLISPIEINVNWPGSKQLWTRPIYTDFSGANKVFMQPYLGLPWTNSCQIWCVRVFHHVLLKYCHENAEMQKRKFDDVTLQYSIGPKVCKICHNQSHRIMLLKQSLKALKLRYQSFGCNFWGSQGQIQDFLKEGAPKLGT